MKATRLLLAVEVGIKRGLQVLVLAEALLQLPRRPPRPAAPLRRLRPALGHEVMHLGSDAACAVIRRVELKHEVSVARPRTEGCPVGSNPCVLHGLMRGPTSLLS